MPPSLRPVLSQRRAARTKLIRKASLARHRALFANFFRRELFSRYLGSVSGLAWAFVHPLALLAVYHFVFTTVFQDRRRWTARAFCRSSRSRCGRGSRPRKALQRGTDEHRRLCGTDPQGRLSARADRLRVGRGHAVAAVRRLSRRAGCAGRFSASPIHFEGLLLAIPLWLVHGACGDRPGARARARCRSSSRTSSTS